MLLTGHTGFKGSWLSLWLSRLDAEVTGFALAPPTRPSLFETAQVGARIRSVVADVRDLERLTAEVERADPEVVLHLAAQSVVRRSYADPLETYTTNVVGTANVFEAVRRVGKGRTVVNVTSDKCYENREWVWGYRENDRLGGDDPYSNSKACSELVTHAYRESFFPVARFEEHRTAIASARGGNVVGGGDWTEDQLVPDVMRAWKAGNPVRIRRPQATRPWQHVLDCLSGYLVLSERLAADGPAFSGPWNFGPAAADTKPVEWVVEQLSRHWGDQAAWSRDAGAHPHEAGLLRLDSSMAVGRLGWMPRLDLRTALEWTAEWYRVFFAGTPALDLCMRQIERYEGLAVR